ncbi:MAG: DNA-3-methyladenine glycosylase 2 family protein [Clostridia bacterium]|nr:DNA-3-methyladenine glycosylase 2 family protein [Clostridia bacterium]
MKIEKNKNSFILSDFGEINLSLTLDCGQAFRWRLQPDLFWRGVAFGREVEVAESPDGLILRGATQEDIERIWIDYFDLRRDYDGIVKTLSRDDVFRGAYEKYGCVRILNQEPWEALCTFILSSCNNIPRIRSLAERLCEHFGDKTETSRTFPSAEKIASLPPGSLDILRAGYRASFIEDAAAVVASGEVSLEKIRELPLPDAEYELMKIRGVGKKVADCALLFGMGRIDCFPVDRHIRRITGELYPEGLPACFDGFGGLAQQYLFCLARNI